jgi:uncharacterized protein with HEPN domain
MVSQAVRERHPEVEWRKMIGMRSVLVHHYWEIDMEVVLNVLLNDLPILKPQIEAILKELGDQPAAR